MEALWELEDKWKLSTQKAIAIFACTSFLLIGACVVAGAWRRRRRESVHQEPCKEILTSGTAAEVEAEAEAWGRCTVAVKVLLGSVRWSCRRSKWEERWGGSQREAPTAVLVKREFAGDGGGGWQSHNSTSAVWQRPILMGEKCELPRFSGLILYDQKGIPLHQCEEGIICTQEMMPTPRTTLRDLL